MKKKVLEVKGICKTGKLVHLRAFDMENDLPIIQNYINHEEVNQFLKVHGPLTIEQEKKHFEATLVSQNNYIFSIVEKSTGKFIGLIGLHQIDWKNRMATTGSVIFYKEYWKKGFGTDAKMLLLDFAFNRLNLYRINSSVIAFNERSAGCLINCGYVEEGRRRNYHFRNGQYHDQILFGILNSEFKEVLDKYNQRA